VPLPMVVEVDHRGDHDLEWVVGWPNDPW
jgi:hypothetical protein